MAEYMTHEWRERWVNGLVVRQEWLIFLFRNKRRWNHKFKSRKFRSSTAILETYGVLVKAFNFLIKHSYIK